MAFSFSSLMKSITPQAIAAAPSIAGAVIEARAAGKAAKEITRVEEENRRERASLAGMLDNGLLDAEFTPVTAAELARDPGYQFRLQQGEEGIQRNAATGYRLNSGETLKELERFRSGLAAEEFDRANERKRDAFLINREGAGDQFSRRANLSSQDAVSRAQAALARAGATQARGAIAGATGRGVSGAIGASQQANSTLAMLRSLGVLPGAPAPGTGTPSARIPASPTPGTTPPSPASGVTMPSLSDLLDLINTRKRPAVFSERF